MKNVLIINPFGIGDVLFSTPLIKAIKAKYPAATISYICNKRAFGVIKDNPAIGKIYIFEKDDYRKLWEESKLKCIRKVHTFLRGLKKDRYDVVFDVSLGYMASLLMATVVRIPVRIGFNYHKRGKFLTAKVDIQGFNDVHAIEYYLKLGESLGLDTSDKQMELFVSSKDKSWAKTCLAEHGIGEREKICGVIPGCGASWGKDANYRRWAPDKFAAVADHVAKKHGYRVLIFGELNELPICSEVASRMKEPSIQICGKTTLGQLAALLERCDLILTNDGGPLHMSAALRKRIVAIFGPVDEKIYGPYPPGQGSVAVTSKDACRPCYRSFRYTKCETLDCLKNIKPEDVISAVDSILERSGERCAVTR